MRIQATEILAKTLTKSAQNPDKYKIRRVKLTHAQLTWFVNYDYFYDNSRYLDTDYDWKTDTYSVLVVIYPDNYYACDKYLSTQDLVDIYNKAQDKTLTGFCKAFFDEVEA